VLQCRGENLPEKRNPDSLEEINRSRGLLFVPIKSHKSLLNKREFLICQRLAWWLLHRFAETVATHQQTVLIYAIRESQEAMTYDNTQESDARRFDCGGD